MNEWFIFCFKINIKWNQTWSHSTKLKSTKYKNPYDRKTPLKNWTTDKSSYDFLLDKTLFLTYQKGRSLLLWKLSIKKTLKSLILVVRMEKSSKSCEWLQIKKCNGIIIIAFNTFPSNNKNSQVFKHSYHKLVFISVIILKQDYKLFIQYLVFGNNWFFVRNVGRTEINFRTLSHLHFFIF